MFSVLDNMPNAGCIQWTGLHMVYQGVTYAIKDGYTNYRYVYWLKSSPGQLVVSDTYPPLGDSDCLVFLNKGGTHLTVPGSTVLDGDLLVPGSILASALSANCVTADAIAAGAVTANALAANSVGANAIAANAITADKIVSEAITADKIAAHSITANELAVGAITAESGVIASIDASKITTGTLSANRIDTTNLKAQRIYNTSNNHYAVIGDNTYQIQGENQTGTGISIYNGSDLLGGMYFDEWTSTDGSGYPKSSDMVFTNKAGNIWIDFYNGYDTDNSIVDANIFFRSQIDYNNYSVLQFGSSGTIMSTSGMISLDTSSSMKFSAADISVLGKFQVQSASVTVQYQSQSARTIVFSKIGNMVIVTSERWVDMGVIPNETTIGTIPGGYWPAIEASAPICDALHGGTIVFTADGYIIAEGSNDLKGFFVPIVYFTN